MKQEMKQLFRRWQKIKQQYPGAVVLIRSGGNYYGFQSDAVQLHRITGTVLECMEEEIPISGFPFSQLDAMLPKLVRAGMRVAVCEPL